METPATNKNTVTSSSEKMGRNMMWMTWSGVISIANSILLWIFIARWREPEELGRFTIVMALYALFFSVCSLGLMTYLVTEISRRNESDGNYGLSVKSEKSIIEFVSSATVFLLISGVICAILMALTGFLVSDSWSVRLSVVILSLALIPSGIIGAAEATAISFGKTRLIAFISTLENVVRTVVPIALIWFGFDITSICASFAAVRFVAFAAYLWAGRHKLSSFDFSKIDFIKLLKVCPTFAATIILASINWQAVIILLSRFSTETESARYGVASRFMIPVSILMASYGNVIQPVITQYIEKSMENAGAYLTKMISYPLILSILAAALSPFLSGYVLTALFGANYADVSLTLNTLALSVVPFCVVMIVSRGLVAVKSQQIDLLANVCGVATCILAGVILIPKYGAVGAATAQLSSFLVMAFVEAVYLSKKLISFRVLQKACVSSIFLLVIYIIIWKI